jgi:hypothetical protein
VIQYGKPQVWKGKLWKCWKYEGCVYGSQPLWHTTVKIYEFSHVSGEATIITTPYLPRVRLLQKQQVFSHCCYRLYHTHCLIPLLRTMKMQIYCWVLSSELRRVIAWNIVTNVLEERDDPIFRVEGQYISPKTDSISSSPRNQQRS